jgi:hypothetical protein
VGKFHLASLNSSSSKTKFLVHRLPGLLELSGGNIGSREGKKITSREGTLGPGRKYIMVWNRVLYKFNS